eukprot:TRINITY_DN806_c0_g1_i1.p1 TRINITY_DN806_c0_g1~~TRINITY_DN806_c0_g1_i1.p1  ORF type:complete len:258 (+),score=56.84 TRINITY_DN806_c0_g1_i1:71-775(+)
MLRNALATAASQTRTAKYVPSMKDIILPPPGGKHTATMIFMHGLGDTGAGWSDLLDGRLPGVKVVLPTAPTMPVSLNQGYEMPAWYDIVGLDSRSNEECVGIEESSDRILELIKKERETVNTILLCGFSQGGALSLYTGLRNRELVSGIAALSSYLPKPSVIPQKKDTDKDLPILQCHGIDDQVVRLEWAIESREAIKKLGNEVEYYEYSNMGHELHPQEFGKFIEWVGKVTSS